MDRTHDAALAAYRIIHPEGPSYSTLSDGERSRWREAYGVARRIEPTVMQLTPAMELNESTFNYVRSLLGGTPSHMITLYGSSVYAEALRFLGGKYNCQWVELPPDVFATRWCWVAASSDGFVWSKPTD